VRSASHPHRSGFTILELLIALAVIVVVATVAIPAWFGRVDVTLNNAIKLLAQDLRDAQDRAAYGRREVVVDFSENGDGYVVQDLEGKPLPAPIGGGPFVRVYSRDAVFRGVTVDSVELGSDGVVRFDDRGFAMNEGSITLAYKSGTRRLRIHSYTGLIEIEGLDEPWIDSH